MISKKNTLFILLLMVCVAMKLSAQTQREINDDAYNNYEKADAELNLVYQQLMKKLDTNEKALLTKAQKNWLEFRDAHCEFEAEENEGGSMQPMVWAMCLEDITKTRINDLKQSINSRGL